ncbi:hypothetical protein [Streptomyces sp. NPDC001889]
MADYVHHECFNALLLGLASHSHLSVAGYGTALAEVCDAVLVCGCGQAGHDEAAELSMGACLWYLLVPRYLVQRQLAHLAHTSSPVATAYALTPPGGRLRSTAAGLHAGSQLHSPSWEPLWHADSSRSAEDNARRIARRCLPRGGLDSDPCAALAASALARCERADALPDLHHLADDWKNVFDAALDASGTPRSGPAARLRDHIGRIWHQTALDSAPEADAAVRLFMDVDQAVRDSYRLPLEEGLLVRRAFFGATTGALELAGLNPYSRLVNGITVTCQ